MKKDFLKDFIEYTITCYRAEELSAPFVNEKTEKYFQLKADLESTLSQQQLKLFNDFCKTTTSLVFQKCNEYYFKGINASISKNYRDKKE